MLRFPAAGPSVIVALPLFEEANRTRTLIVGMLRRLAAAGIGGALPDLPGHNESIVPTREARLAAWRSAFAAAAHALPAPVHVVAVRGGALLDGEVAAAGRWHASPLTGVEQVRELERLRGAGEDHAGNILHPALLDDLRAATAEPARVVRLDGDPRAADRHLPFAPPWRAAEPRADAALERAWADDIAGWIASCGG